MQQPNGRGPSSNPPKQTNPQPSNMIELLILQRQQQEHQLLQQQRLRAHRQDDKLFLSHLSAHLSATRIPPPPTNFAASNRDMAIQQLLAEQQQRQQEEELLRRHQAAASLLLQQDQLLQQQQQRMAVQRSALAAQMMSLSKTSLPPALSTVSVPTTAVTDAASSSNISCTTNFSAPEKDPKKPRVKKKDTKWLSTLQQLKEYKREHGDCVVPRGYTSNPKLASWVAEQRKQYKLLIDGKQSSITSQRVALLNELDFAWNAQEAAWSRHMEHLERFRQRNGHCHVPLNHFEHPKLGLWVKEQRRHYTLMKQGKPSHMTQERIAQLDRVGFCWDTHEATWLERLRELKEYKKAYGNSLVNSNHSNHKLVTWVSHQRRQYRKFMGGKPCHITQKRIDSLEEIGFVWHPRDRSGISLSSASSSEEDDDASESSEPQFKKQRLE